MADVEQDVDQRNAIKFEVLQERIEIISSTQLLDNIHNGEVSIATIENEINVLKKKTEGQLRNDPQQHSVKEKVYFDDVEPLRNIKDEMHLDGDVPVRYIKDEVQLVDDLSLRNIKEEVQSDVHVSQVQSDVHVSQRNMKDEVHSCKDSSTVAIKDEKQKCTIFEKLVQCFPANKENPDHLEKSQLVNLSKKNTSVKFAKNCFLPLPI